MNDELTLAIETSTRDGTVAFGVGDVLYDTRTLPTDSRHAGGLLPAIKELLERHGRRFRDLDLLIFSQGPGSFTGLRIAAALATLAQSTTGCRVVGVPSLMVIACNALRRPECPPRIVSVLDAGSGRVYIGIYKRVGPDEIATLHSPSIVSAAECLQTIAPPYIIIGTGFKACLDTKIGPPQSECLPVLGESGTLLGGVLILGEEYRTPDVSTTYRLGRRQAAAGCLCRPEEIVPLYLRPPASEEVYEQRREEARRRRGEA